MKYALLIMAFSLPFIPFEQNSLWQYLNGNIYNENIHGNVGIGTPSPTERLTVNGNVKADAFMSAGIVVGGKTPEIDYPFEYETIGANHPEFNVRVQSPNAIYLTGGVGKNQDSTYANKIGVSILDNDHVGIGTIDPQCRLHIIDSDASITNGNGGGLLIGSINDDNLVVDRNEIMARKNGQTSTLYLQAEGGNLHMHSNVEKKGTEFSIKNNGKVGIGTLNPDYQLHLKGDGFIKLEQNGTSGWGELNVTADGRLRLFRHAGNSRKGIDITGSSVISTTSFLTHQGTDFRLGTNDGRPKGSKKDQRALVHNNNGVGGRSDALHINYNGDFEGGVRIQGSHGLKVDGYIYANARKIGDHRNVQYNTTTKEFGWDNSSRKDKRNIKSLKADFYKILEADSKTYTREWDKDRWEVGFIAEDFHDLGLFPLVEYDEKGTPDGIKYDKTILYVVPILREQQKELDQKQIQINQLKERLAKLELLFDKKFNREQTNIHTNRPILDQTQILQNYPNPFDHSTQIHYQIPHEVNKAILQILNDKGQLVQQIEIKDRGHGQSTIKSNSLREGSYWYSLIIDGILVDTKKMLFNRE